MLSAPRRRRPSRRRGGSTASAADLRRFPAIIGSVAALLACADPWREDAVLGVAFEWPVGSERHYPEAARAICDAALLAEDPRLINGASVVVLETAGAVESACLSSGVVACWHPDYDDEAGAGTIYIGPPRDGEPFSDGALKHELGHLIRWRAQHDADANHADADWWALYDAEILVCVEP